MIGRVIDREKNQPNPATATIAPIPTNRMSRRERVNSSSTARVRTDTREMPSGMRTATYNSSLPADAETRLACPLPRARASRTSGLLR